MIMFPLVTGVVPSDGSRTACGLYPARMCPWRKLEAVFKPEPFSSLLGRMKIQHCTSSSAAYRRSTVLGLAFQHQHFHNYCGWMRSY